MLVDLNAFDDSLKKELNFPKVELHLHLDGAIRHQTLLELSLEKKIPMKDAQTLDEVKKYVTAHTPASLGKVLEAFDIFLPVVAGDKDAIERIAYELCEDRSKEGVIYFEARYSPHLLANTVTNLASQSSVGVYKGKGDLTPQQVVEAVKRGLDRGEAEFDVKARQILCCIHGFEEWNDELLEIASLNSLGVVAIDIAGCSQKADESSDLSQKIIKVFRGAAERGLHRTVHAGESGDWDQVVFAVEHLKADRIGHGYHLLANQEAYQKIAIEKRIHLEACPYSSIVTGAVPLDWPNHPLKKFADDDINYSINTDDPTLFENTLSTEYCLAYKHIGLSKLQLWKASLNAANSCFATEDVKKEIVNRILAAKPS